MEGKRIKTQDPLKEVKLGSDNEKKLTFINKMLIENEKRKFFEVLKKYIDCFTWINDKIPLLSMVIM